MKNNDYIVSSKLYEGSDLILHRAIKKNDGRPVILKQIKGEYSYVDKFSLFKAELEITKSLPHKGIINILEITGTHHAPALVMEDFEGEVLANILAGGRFGIQSFLQVAIELADILAFVHNANASHYHIQPENILIDPDSGAVKLTGFKPYFGMPGNQDSPILLSKFDIAYISPEQTGRVVHKVDYRTDFYSLGVVFYQMLTGILPFHIHSEDYTEIIYSHLAREAVPVCALNREVPQVLSGIVGKLMQKKAEKRYQTMLGLRRDLEECRKRLTCQKGINVIKPFSLGRYDTPVQVRFPREMFRREKEIDRLMACFDEVREGKLKLIFIAGHPGVGKTTLAREIHTPVRNSGGLFLTGKFHQYKRNTPYAALIQAFDLLIREILVQDKDKITAWKNRITGTLGDNTVVITHIFPKLAQIIGPGEQVEEIPLYEAQHRLNRVLISFLQAVATKENPLVIFLDDL